MVWCGQVPRPHALRMACHNPTRPPMSQVSYLPYASVDVICACKCICICTHIHINSPQLHIYVDQHIWTNFLNQVKLPVPFYPIWFANDPPRPSPAHHILLCFQNSIARSLDLAPSRSWLLPGRVSDRCFARPPLRSHSIHQSSLASNQSIKRSHRTALHDRRLNFQDHNVESLCRCQQHAYSISTSQNELTSVHIREHARNNFAALQRHHNLIAPFPQLI